MSDLTGNREAGDFTSEKCRPRRAADTDLPGKGAGWREAARGPVRWMARPLWLVRDFIEYRRGIRRLNEAEVDLACLFEQFRTASVGRCAVQISFNEERVPCIGVNWERIDLGARRWDGRSDPLRDYAVGSVDVVFCTGLQRAPRPSRVVAAVRRVLSSTGQVWVQVPFNGPCRSTVSDGVPEYWRISPDGLRLLMRGFDEIFCSACPDGGSVLRTMSFFYGLKAEPVAGDAPMPGTGVSRLAC